MAQKKKTKKAPAKSKKPMKSKTPVKKAKTAKSKTSAGQKTKATKPTKTKKANKSTAGKSPASKASNTLFSERIKSLTPLDDRLVVEMQSFEKMTPGGLYIPETAELAGHYKGRVIAVGKGHTNKKGRVRPMDVKAGDEVLFDQYSGSKLNWDGREIRILRETEVLGIIESR